MPGIDATRLSRLLATLGKPAHTTTSVQAPTTAVNPGARKKTAARDPAVLRARLRNRLVALKQAPEDFDRAAPIITVQEILRWEFGESIVAHAEFEQIAGKVAEALLADEKIEGAIQRVIKTLLD